MSDNKVVTDLDDHRPHWNIKCGHGHIHVVPERLLTAFAAGELVYIQECLLQHIVARYVAFMGPM